MKKILVRFMILLNLALAGLFCVNYSFASDSILVGGYFISSVSAEGESDLTKTSFTLDVNSLTPGVEKYAGGPKENIGNILKKISRFLLIAIPTLAVMFMVVGGIKIMLAGGDSGKINNGKAIITYNIIAVVLALLSWSIIQLIIWVIGSAT